jgi:DNA-binding transcriptional ArsR family regulator
MDDIPDHYNLETVEQMRAISDELRQRILGALIDRPMTVTQLGEQLGIAPAKIHYHVRELERVRLVRLVETREKGGILEKYYRSVARNMSVPRTLLESLSPDETITTLSEYFQDIQQGFTRALAHAMGDEDAHRRIALTRDHLWLTDDEFPAVIQAIDRALEPYQRPRAVAGEKERTFIKLMYETRAAAEPSEASMPADRSARRGLTVETERSPRNRRIWVAGALSWSLSGLEAHLQRDEVLDVTILGVHVVEDDVPPELVDRVVATYNHRGILQASPEVRAVLKRKRQVPPPSQAE